MKILIADDHGMCREGLKATFSKIMNDVEFFEAETQQEVRSLLNNHQDFDFAVLDLCLADGGGLELVEEVHDENPELPLAVFSANDDPSVIRSIMSFGVKGYLSKGLRNSVLRNAIELILAGGIYVPQQISNLPRANDLNGNSKILTPRQRQVLNLIAKGCSNKEIGRTLQLAEGTIKSHVATLLRSLGARNRTEAATKAKEVGYLH